MAKLYKLKTNNDDQKTQLQQQKIESINLYDEKLKYKNFMTSDQQQTLELRDKSQNNYSIPEKKKLNIRESEQKSSFSEVTAMQKFVRLSGVGNFGKVEIIVDYKSARLYAKKNLIILSNNIIFYCNIIQKYNKFEQSYYLQEQMIFTSLNNDFIIQKHKLQQLAILPCYCSDEQNAIYFVHGICSLDQLFDKYNFSLNADQAVYVFTVLLEFMLLMKDYGYCHSDIKPANTQLVKCDEIDNAYSLKLIDFGALSKQQLQYQICTPAFFNSPNRKYDQKGFVVFDSLEERYKNEFYSVIRTFQYVLLQKQDRNYFSIGKDSNNKIRLIKLLQLQIYISEKYKDINEMHLLRHILQFISYKGLEEQYNFKDLEELLQFLKDNMTDQQKYFYDTENQISKLLQKSFKRQKQRTDPLSLLFGLNIFINQMGSYTQLSSIEFDLMETLIQQLKQPNSNNIVLVGESGAGKTLILINLKKQLQQMEFDSDIVFLNLTEVSKQADFQKALYLLNDIQKQIQEEYFQQRENLILLLDDYDELANINLRISDLIHDQFNKNYKQIKILVTTRPHYTSSIELNDVFNNPTMIRICPLNRIQIVKYIGQFLEKYQQFKDYIFYQDRLKRIEDYLEIIDQQNGLDQLCQLPFTLSLVVFMIPELKKRLEQQSQSANAQCSKYKTYDIFTDIYYHDRIQQLQDKNNTQYLQITGQQNSLKKLNLCTKIFNQNCSWHILKNQKPELSQQDLLIVFNEIYSNYKDNLLDIKNLLQEISPTTATNQNSFRYIHY